MLPPDLRAAEDQLLEAALAALKSGQRGLWTLELRFEGLRLLPVALRLASALQQQQPLRLLCSDMGATALARRDAPDLADAIASFSDQQRLLESGASEGEVLLLLGATPADYAIVEILCEGHGGPVLLLNPTLEDAAVGIGSVARQRRRGFLSRCEAAYALIPMADSALRRAYPGPWELYRLDPDGYRLIADFERRPDGEQQAEALGGNALQGNLRALGELIEGLQN